MSLRAFRSGCNVIAVRKNSKNYGMVCAWATMIDYDKIGMLIGGQSVTGKMIHPCDLVGVSALAEGQEEIAHKLGENHSGEGNKFEGVDLINKDGALLVKGAKCHMICEVSKIVKLVDPSDSFVVLQVLKHEADKNKEFLSLEAVYPED